MYTTLYIPLRRSAWHLRHLRSLLSICETLAVTCSQVTAGGTQISVCPLQRWLAEDENFARTWTEVKSQLMCQVRYSKSWWTSRQRYPLQSNWSRWKVIGEIVFGTQSLWIVNDILIKEGREAWRDPVTQRFACALLYASSWTLVTPVYATLIYDIWSTAHTGWYIHSGNCPPPKI
jgi:hypothetical protein